MVDFLDSWVHLLPVWILDNILDQLIFPKLQKEVENWNPLTDTVPIHSWIHPWLPLMQSRLEPLFSPIRNKLASALQKWHPSDSSAKLILQPWKDVFTPGSWDAFMVKNIVPKLGELSVQLYCKGSKPNPALEKKTPKLSWSLLQLGNQNSLNYKLL
ncbi:hypothetical protein AB205_0129330 [Aquarana catesbeiana]|uniref:GCF C-terminal domain-containing protein n=1 Tax=Aquarana catesbeiana TaxID=8400 RepID=A0A2G9RGA8_AQUCT|nr:hypothetical protein AB205_0129330 [Aquarana catesbeiana]